MTTGINDSSFLLVTVFLITLRTLYKLGHFHSYRWHDRTRLRAVMNVAKFQNETSGERHNYIMGYQIMISMSNTGAKTYISNVPCHNMHWHANIYI